MTKQTLGSISQILMAIGTLGWAFNAIWRQKIRRETKEREL